jgi:hypothetical protein
MLCTNFLLFQLFRKSRSSTLHRSVLSFQAHQVEITPRAKYRKPSLPETRRESIPQILWLSCNIRIYSALVQVLSLIRDQYKYIIHFCVLVQNLKHVTIDKNGRLWPECHSPCCSEMQRDWLRHSDLMEPDLMCGIRTTGKGEMELDTGKLLNDLVEEGLM